MTTEPERSLDGYGPQDMAIPEWRLKQKIGGDWAGELGVKPGQFYNTITDEIADELNIIVVDIPTGRARWGEEIKNIGPICASLNARSNNSINGDDCTQCEYRVDTPWSLDAPERRKMCCLNYTILGIDLDHDNLPVMVRAHGISALPARQLITQLKMNRALRGEYHKAIVNIISQEKNTPYGTAFAIRPKIVHLITDEAKAQELKEESQRLLGTPIALPVGRPEEELEPLGFLSDGTPFYSEEEKERLIASQESEPTAATEPTPVPAKVLADKEQPPSGEKGKGPVESPPVPPDEPIDLDF